MGGTGLTRRQTEPEGRSFMPRYAPGYTGRMDLDALTRHGDPLAFELRTRLVPDLAGEAGFAGVGELIAALARRTVCLTMLAGSGSRWVASLKEAGGAGFDPDAPRGLFPVRNWMGFGPDPVPIAGYALGAVRDLGRHVIVVRGWEREIEGGILAPLGYPPGSWAFATQEAPLGKPRGHGDAASQAMPLWEGADYVVVNFGGDASSPLSALAGLAALDAMARAWGERAPGLLLPVASVEAPAYPIRLGADGLPRAFGHAKLQGGGASTPAAAESGLTNVGLRLYRSKALKEAIAAIRAESWKPGSGYAIPGNAPASDGAGGEFALDNVDARLASEGRARVIRLCRPEELSPVKSLGDLPAFERRAAAVCEDWREFRAYSNSGIGLEKK